MIIGHSVVRDVLRSKSRGSRFAQSYIFSGPESVGKFLVAEEWAAQLAGGPEKLSDSRSDGNIIVVAPRTETEKGITREKSLTVKDVRDALREIRMLPYGAMRRTLIIRGAHRMTEEAQNALLKTLEEPPEHAVVILVTHEVGRIIPTVLSRCQTIEFHPVGEADMREAFSGKGVPEELLLLGRPGLTLRFLESPGVWKDDLDRLRALEHIDGSSGSERIAMAEELVRDTVRLGRILDWWMNIVTQRRRRGDLPRADDVLLSGRILETVIALRNRPSGARLLLENFLISL